MSLRRVVGQRPWSRLAGCHFSQAPGVFEYTNGRRADAEDNLLSLLLDTTRHDTIQSTSSTGAPLYNILKDLKSIKNSRLAIPIVNKYVSLEQLGPREFTLLIQVLDDCGHGADVLNLYR